MSIKQRLDIERQYRDHESNQVRLAGRRKFQFCHRCGTTDGMQSVHRVTLMEMTDVELSWLTWYSDDRDGEHLFYPCPICNRDNIIPGYMKLMGGILSVRIWCADNKPDDDPMSPDYAALAAEEPMLASEMDRDSAGL